MRRCFLALALLIATASALQAAPDKALADCRANDLDRSVSGCTAVLTRKPTAPSSIRADAFRQRGMALASKKQYERAIPDLTDALALDPKDVSALGWRGDAYALTGEGDKAIADYSEALKISPGSLDLYVKRGVILYRKGDYERVIADTTAALGIDPVHRIALNTRGAAYNGKGDYDRALADLNEAIRLDPKSPNAYRHRGFAQEKKGELAQALASYEVALALNPTYKDALEDRGRVRTAMTRNETPKAVPPVVAAATTPAATPAASPVVAAKPLPPALEPMVAPMAPGARRVALVVGNGAYRELTALPNPPNDARDIATALRGLDFDVTLIVDGTRAEMEEKFATFAKSARSADVAIAFYAGHALQHQEVNYLAPVDAKLSDEVDLRLRFIKVQDLIDDLQSAKGVRVLVIDACRDNEAVKQLASVQPRSRSAGVTRGLARQEAEGMLIAYATSRNTVAQDGAERNSPFTAALLKYLPTPGLEIRTLFTRVRTDVLRATGGKQRPELSDSLDGEYTFR